MLKCDDILKYIDQYWLMDDSNNLKIEIEAHLCDCEHCSQLFDVGLFSIDEPSSWQTQTMTADGVKITQDVMSRIYSEDSWAKPVQEKSYQFTKKFKRNTGIVVAASIVILFIGLFSFLSQDAQVASNYTEVTESGVIDVAVATSSSPTTDILTEHVAVASLSDPIIMEAVPSYSQYYVALAIIAIIGTLLILNWFTRTKQ